jgi:hypothetical protein
MEVTIVNGYEQRFFVLQYSCFEIIWELSVLFIISVSLLLRAQGSIECSEGKASMFCVDIVPTLAFSWNIRQTT